MLNERYQRGAEMLGSDRLAVRLGGIEALRRLKEDSPELYHLQVTRLPCAFARELAKDSNGGTDPAKPPVSEEMPFAFLRADVQTAIAVIGSRSDKALQIEAAHKDYPELDSTGRKNRFMWGLLNLARAGLRGGHYPMKLNLSDTPLAKTILSGAQLDKAEFSGAHLHETDLSSARLMTDFKVFRPDLVEAGQFAHAWKVNLGGANLRGSKNLTQDLIDTELFWADPPPLGFDYLDWSGHPPS